MRKSDLAGKRNAYEDEMMRQLRAAIPRAVQVTIVADRGFADQKFYDFLQRELGFGYLIRFRANILVTDAKGVCKPAREWARPDGRLVRLKDAKVTGDGLGVGQVVMVQESGMKDVWSGPPPGGGEDARTGTGPSPDARRADATPAQTAAPRHAHP